MNADLDRIRDALPYISSHDRDTWVRVGMSVKSALGEAGFALWDSWSQESESYNAHDARDVWKSIKANGKVTVGTLFHEAKANGWCDTGIRSKSTQEELAERQRQTEAQAAKDRAEIERERADCARRAVAIWAKATKAPAGQPYLARKGVAPVDTLREIEADVATAILGYAPWSSGEPLSGRLLVVPVKTGDRLSTVELIDSGGRKTALKGHGTKAGGYWAAQKLPDGDLSGLTLLIGEGVATALSGREATGYPAVAALSSGNLLAVARTMRDLYSEAQLIILAELVKATGEPDPHAVEAARAVGGLVAVPDFGDARPEGATDFNDLANTHGLDRVRRAIASAKAPAIPKTRCEPGGVPGGDSGGLEWPEPQSLPAGLAAVEPFRFELLPEALRPWVSDICERIQCPPDYVGVSAMTALSTALGRKVAIRPQAQTDWSVVANLWALIIGRPGVLKSPAMEAALALLKRLASLAFEAYEQAAKDHQRDKAVAKLKAVAAEKQAQKMLEKNPQADVVHLLLSEDPAEPILHRYIANDTTAAALGELLRQNPRGVLVHRDEIVSLLRSLDREDNAEARGFYLTAWNGDSGYTFDRITRGMNLHIPAVCLSVLGSTQPGRIAHYIRQAVKGGAGDDGLIQRFGLLVWPDTGGDWREVDHWPDSEARQQAFEAFSRLDQLDPVAVGATQDTGFSGGPDGLPYLRFDEHGLGLFQEWRQDLEVRLRGVELHPAMESHLAKYRKLVPGLALLLHLADGHTGPVGRLPVLQALSWAEYLETHANRAYGAVTAPEADAAKAVLSRIRRGDLSSQFSSRDVWRPCWAGLNDRDVVLDALNLLTDFDWLRVDEVKTGGRPATIYTANPRATQ